MKKRVIIHSDLNNFYASVECMLDSSLDGKPVAVAGNPQLRHGVILAKNAIAKAHGVKTGDVIWQAQGKCPGLIVLPPHFDLYEKYSREVFDIYTRFSPQVEPFGPDECWLDCSGCERLFGKPEQIAQKILSAVRRQTGLTVSVGISFSKPFAKLCSDLANPNGYFMASEDDFKRKIWPIDVGNLIFVGRSTREKLRKLNINTVGDLANADEELLRKVLGINGLKLRSAANGTDGESVRDYDKSRPVESVGHGMTASRDITSTEDIHSLLIFLAEKISARLVKSGFKGFGVHTALRTADLVVKSRQSTLKTQTFSSDDIADRAFADAKIIWSELGYAPLRSMSISVFDLVPSDNAVQISMFDTTSAKRDKLEQAVNEINRKYGRGAVTHASLIESDFIYDKNDSEDFLPFKR
ncbi:MAG: DNA polymerase IV [Clostridia bacterium]|nr:DNA polymerase IV [Clostridia bacterium]